MIPVYIIDPPLSNSPSSNLMNLVYILYPFLVKKVPLSTSFKKQVPPSKKMLPIY